MSTGARVGGARPPGIPRESWLRRKTIKSGAARRVREAMSDSRKCSVAGCGRAYHGVGLCQAHYMRKRRHGEPTAGVHEVGRPLTAEERFLAKVSKDATGCWLWTGSTTSKGYGLFRHGRVMPAYRFAHIHFIGPIPEGLEVDHLCSVRACVNPEHLEAVTHSENLRRAQERGSNRAN